MGAGEGRIMMTHRYRSTLPTAFQPEIKAANYHANYPANRLPTASNCLPTACFQPPIPPVRLEAASRALLTRAPTRLRFAPLGSKPSRKDVP
jgi:hypothetical protein